MAEDPTSARLKYKAHHSDRLNPNRAEPAPGISEQRRDLWNAMNAYCREQGASVVSVPGARDLRIECRKDSALPSKLKTLGYAPVHCGVATRVTANSFTTVDVIEIALGK